MAEGVTASWVPGIGPKKATVQIPLEPEQYRRLLAGEMVMAGGDDFHALLIISHDGVTALAEALAKMGGPPTEQRDL